MTTQEDQTPGPRADQSGIPVSEALATHAAAAREPTAPGTTAPAATIPKAAAPKTTAPEATAPEATAPKAAVPRGSAPNPPHAPAARTVGDDVARIQRRTVRTLVLAQVVGGIGVGSSLAVSGLLAEELSGSRALSGLAVTAITLGAGLCAIPLARLADKRGRRVALATGWGVATAGALGVIASAVLGWYPALLVSFVVFGAGSAANLQSRYAAADLADDATRARSLAIVVWSTTVGAVLGPNLNTPGAAVGRFLGLPELAGPYVFSTLAFAAGGLTMWFMLRPDPLLVARGLAAAEGGAESQVSRKAAQAATAADADPTPPPAPGPPAAQPSSWSVVRASRSATLALASVVLGHAVMVSVMTMTPVHMKDHGADLTVVGLTISLHIAGMYAFSPVVGWAADKLGRIPVIVVGQLILLAAVLVAGLSGRTVPLTVVGLVLLGVGWSCSMVAGSALLAESVPPRERPRVQGASDLLMNLAGAAGGALSGAVLGVAGYGGLNAAAGMIVLPVLAVVGGYALGRSRTAAR